METKELADILTVSVMLTVLGRDPNISIISLSKRVTEITQAMLLVRKELNRVFEHG